MSERRSLPSESPNSARGLDPVERPGSQPSSQQGSSDDIPRKTPLPPIISDSLLQPGYIQQDTEKPTILRYKRETEPDGYVKPVFKDYSRPQEEGMSMLNAECQTEWSWLEDMRMIERSRGPSRASSPRSAVGSPAPLDEAARHKAQSAASRQVDSELTFVGSEVSNPYPSREDEYGIPQLNVDGDSETSDSDSELEPTARGVVDMEDLNDDELKLLGKEVGTLPSIGPPKILNYRRETVRPRQEDAIDQAPIGEPKDSSEHMLTDSEIERIKAEYSDKGMFSGECEFCKNQIKPFPTLEAQKVQPPEELYCCPDYQEFVKYILTHPVAAENNKPKRIDVKPHAPYGSGQARKAAKERAAQRMREREIAKQQATITATHKSDAHTSGGGGSNFYNSGLQFNNFARSMKTINYALSSQKCLDEGWTVRPPSPKEQDELDEDIFEPEPLLPSWAEAEGQASDKRQLIVRNYQNGNKFLILFPDGTGNVFYPSGRPAITIASHDERGLYTYVMQDDEDDPARPNVLGMFDSNGTAATFYSPTNQTRLHLDPVGGMELDARGARRKRWSWKEQVQHVHAPPIQPLTFSLNQHMGLRIMSQDNVSLTFRCLSRSVRFQIGARLKVKNLEHRPQPAEIEEDDLYRDEVKNRIESLFAKVANLLKFPNSPKLLQLPTPKHITSRVQRMDKIKEVQTARRNERKQTKGQPIVSVN